MDRSNPGTPKQIRWQRQTPALLALMALMTTMAIILACSTAAACTNFLITAGASEDGSTMVTYTADSHSFYGGYL